MWRFERDDFDRFDLDPRRRPRQRATPARPGSGRRRARQGQAPAFVRRPTTCTDGKKSPTRGTAATRTSSSPSISPRRRASRCSSTCDASCLREAKGGRAARLLHCRSTGLRWLAEATRQRWTERAPRARPSSATRSSSNASTSRRGRRQADESFGRALAAMHRIGATRVRRAGNGYIGPLAARQHRVGRLADVLRDSATRTVSSEARRPGRAARVDHRHASTELAAAHQRHRGPTGTAGRASTATCGAATCSRRSDGRTWVIDPAAHGGHRETDLAMMRLFGGFGPACYAAYDEAFPLAAGTRGPGRARTNCIRCSSTPSSSVRGYGADALRAARRSVM